jgi:hypothetical protein
MVVMLHKADLDKNQKGELKIKRRRYGPVWADKLRNFSSGLTATEECLIRIKGKEKPMHTLNPAFQRKLETITSIFLFRVPKTRIRGSFSVI